MPDDVETRLTTLEHDVARLRERVAVADTMTQAVHVLAAGAGREVSELRSELRAHIQILNALRETQLKLREAQVEQGRTLQEQGHTLREQGRMIQEQGHTLREQGHKLDALKREVREGFATLGTEMAQITALLTGRIEEDSPHAG